MSLKTSDSQKRNQEIVSTMAGINKIRSSCSCMENIKIVTENKVAK